MNSNPTYAKIFSRLYEILNTWDTQHNDNDLITHLLHKEQQIQTIYSNGCTPLNFTIFLESTSDDINLYFEVLGYTQTDLVRYHQCNIKNPPQLWLGVVTYNRTIIGYIEH